MAVSNENHNAISIARMEERLKYIEDDVKEIKDSVKELTSTSARVKGGFFIVLMLGGIIGWLTTLGTSLYKFWPFS